jgi:hypothetical protein
MYLCKDWGFHGGDYEEEEEEEEREKWVVVRDTTGGGNRIYHRFWRFLGIASLSFW